MKRTDAVERRAAGSGYALTAAIYLFGIFIGALDTGIVTPGRTVIQSDLGVSDQLGIWMITIYTLAYAASIPVMGKLADRHGRKRVYLLSILLFGTGSLFCGLAQSFDSFQVLLAARAVQAIGGGGILPVATAEFGTAFPPEKRGMALGLVGAVYGVANVLGASVGSAILDAFGSHNWPFIFFINLPICAFILIAGAIKLPNTRASEVQPIDGAGICVLTAMTLSLMYGLKNIDFFDLGTSLAGTDVYPFLLAAIALLPLFILVERHAADPVMNLSYFKNRDIVITLLIGIITGIVLMGMIFIPQFAENALRLNPGDGGYLVVVLALFSGIGAPVSGKLIDKYGVKAVLGAGLGLSVAGALYLALVTCSYPTWPNVLACLIVMGLGMGFTMGTPINYMMLAKTDERESNSALATLSLVRSIGTAVAPAIMVAFIAHAGTLVQDRITETLPTQISVPALPYAQELDAEFAKLRADDSTKDLVSGMDVPNLESMQTVSIDMNADGSTVSISDDLTQMMKDSNVTTITGNTETFASAVFAQISPSLISDAVGGIEKGEAGITSGRADIDSNLASMQEAVGELDAGIAGIDSARAQQMAALDQMKAYLPLLKSMDSSTSVLDLMPAGAKASMPQSVLDELAGVRTAADLQAKIDGLQAAIDSLGNRLSSMQEALAGVESGIEGMQGTLSATQARLDADRIALAQATDPAVIAQLQEDIAGEEATIASLQPSIANAEAQASSLQSGIDELQAAIAGQEQGLSMMQAQLPTLQKLESATSVLDLMPAGAKASMPQSVLDELAGVRTAADLQAKIDDLQAAIDSLAATRAQMVDARAQLEEGIAALKDAEAEMDTTLARMDSLKAAIPGAFEAAREAYLKQIEERSDAIESAFQDTLNEGFRGMFLLVAACSAVGLVLLVFYRDDARTKNGS